MMRNDSHQLVGNVASFPGSSVVYNTPRFYLAVPWRKTRRRPRIIFTSSIRYCYLWRKWEANGVGVSGVDILAFWAGVKNGLAFISRPCLLCAVWHLFITTLGATPLHLDKGGGKIACSDTGLSLYGANLGLFILWKIDRSTSGPSPSELSLGASLLEAKYLYEYSSSLSYTTEQPYTCAFMIRGANNGDDLRSLPVVSCRNSHSLQVTIAPSPGRGRMVPQCGQNEGSVLKMDIAKVENYFVG